MKDINLLYSIWVQLIQAVRSNDKRGALHCVNMIKQEIESE